MRKAPPTRASELLTPRLPRWSAPEEPIPRGRHCHSAEGPVSRILSCAVIPLGGALPLALISDLPGGFGNCSSRLVASGRCASPLGSSRCFPPYLVLLRVGFTTPRPHSLSGRSYHFTHLPRRRGRKLINQQVAPGRPSGGSRGGIFSVALAVHGFEAHVPDVIRHCLRVRTFLPREAGAQAPGSDRPVTPAQSLSLPRISSCR